MEWCRRRSMTSSLPCRLLGRRFNSPIMLVGLVCFVFFSLSLFTCCTVDRADAGLDPSLRQRRHRAVRTQLADDDELRYQRDIGFDEENIISHLRRKTLLEDTVGNKARVRNGADSVVVDSYADETSDTEDDSPDAYDDLYEGHSHRKGRGRRRYPGGDEAGADQNGTKRLPVAVIIGVKKGGTRAMLEFLRIHPDIRAPGPETHFFDKNYHLGLEWYRQQMPPTMDGQITIEKTPSYFVTKGVPGRIYNMSKNIKLIVVVRDPVIRAISDYTQVLSKRSSMKSFEQMAFLDNSTRVVDTSWSAIKIGVYARHLERWLQYFPLEQIHFASGEKLIENPATEMAKVQDFLGIKRVITDKHFYFNTTKGFPCLKKTEGSGNPHCLGKTKGRTHPDVNPQVEERLRDFFRPFNQKFYQMTGIDFGWS